MEYLDEFVRLPQAIKDQKKYKEFVDELVSKLDVLPADKRRVLLEDLVKYSVSLAELYFSERKMGGVKKAAVMESLCKIIPDDGSLDDMVESVLKYGDVMRKSLYIKAKIWLKKKARVVLKL